MCGHNQMLATIFCVLQISFPFAKLGYGSESISGIVQVKHHAKEDFLRIPELFTGKEYSGKYIILRSSEFRNGLYFYLPFTADYLSNIGGSTIELALIDSSLPKARAFNFSIPDNFSGQKKVLLGLTGKDWDDNKIRLVAWKIEVLGLEKESLHINQSSLWSHKK